MTLAGAVPTIWLDVLRYADEHKPDLSSLRPRRVRRLGRAALAHAGLRGAPRRAHRPGLGHDRDEPAGLRRPAAGRHRGRGALGVPLDGRAASCRSSRRASSPATAAIAPWDGETTGELEVRGPWIAAEYYEDPAGAEKFHDGWLRTGDVAAIDADGYIRITDRAKDVIKSGGEWISSVELEIELMAHPAVAEAAVIAMPHERWSERPLACVVLAEGASATAEELREHLRSRVAKWWLPDEFAFIDEVPKTSVGKFDKKSLRAPARGRRARGPREGRRGRAGNRLSEVARIWPRIRPAS